MYIVVFSIMALFGVYSLFVGILRIVTGQYSKRWRAAVVALITSIMEIVIPVSAYYVSSNGILSDNIMWLSVCVLVVLNYLVFVRWGRIKD